MRIDFCVTLACHPDAAWEALHRSDVVASLYAPLMRLTPQEKMPARFSPGTEVTVRLRAAGVLSVGRQTIRISDESHGAGEQQVRTMHDTGESLSGPLSLLSGWHHRMSISAAPGHAGLTRWHDQLQFHGAAAVVAWPALWLTWQWRARRIRAAAPTWNTAA